MVGWAWATVDYNGGAGGAEMRCRYLMVFQAFFQAGETVSSAGHAVLQAVHQGVERRVDSNSQ
jgi:hypothetical protein